MEYSEELDNVSLNAMRVYKRQYDHLTEEVITSEVKLFNEFFIGGGHIGEHSHSYLKYLRGWLARVNVMRGES